MPHSPQQRGFALAVTAAAAIAVAGAAAPASAATPASSAIVLGVVDERPTYKIDNVVTGGHLVPEGWGSNSNDIPIYAVVSDLGNGWNFRERRDLDGWAYYQIRNSTTKKCIRPAPFAVGNRTLVIQETCDTADSYQYWRVERSISSPQRVQIINRASEDAFQPWTPLNVDQWVFMTNPGTDLTHWVLRPQ
ncbi:hypothetical protein HNP84_004227 [Thermocatellispora tengchongensis]|uniref:Ricin B lectin domain-containing protein n=1 Tax=Thermocatellispora tengchongensis TaxID=1073253 RepID=A0A840PEM9_9ACTN|nr:RICIN domain-containing protein [Thermocatellispora tengchongensis]MBB5134495.1 hypothetical protein [Thermocatellispora tengchongensis]